MNPITGTFFFHKVARHKQEFHLTPDALVELVEHHHKPRKADLQWIKLARFGDHRSGKDALRNNDNVLAVTGIEADYDGETISFDDAVEKLEDAGIESIAYTSPSHREDKPRWRILAPLSREYPPGERARFLARLNGLFNGMLGDESFTLSQSYYFGFVGNAPPASHRAKYIAGQFIDARSDLDPGAIGRHSSANSQDGETGTTTSRFDIRSAIDKLIEGGDFHPTILPLAASMAARGMERSLCTTLMSSLFDQAAAQRTDLADRRNEVHEIIAWVYEQESKKKAAAAPARPLSSAQFVAGFIPPDYVIDGIIQRRFCYALTGKTGSGKTAILLMIAAHVALGRPIGTRNVEQGRILYLAGENPDDARMRWIAMADEINFDINTIPVNFIPETFKISTTREQLNTIENLTLVIVDTSAAYFEGKDENSNKELGDHARLLRSLTTLPGRPCVIAACHPVKNPDDNNLLPRGGGAFVAEIDGNLTAQKTDTAIEVHWQGKHRGPDFSPVVFQLHTITNQTLKDSKGRLIPTVVAKHLSEQGQADIEAAARDRQNKLLTLIATNGNDSLAILAERLGWKTRDGQPYKMLVKRTLATLLKLKLITQTQNGHEPTPAGKKYLAK